MEKNKRKKVGLALSTGEARGMSHIGVIKVLTKNNIPIDYISGSSMGAIIGGFYALHGEVKTLENDFANMRKRDLLKLVDLNNPKISLIKGQKINLLLKKYFKNKNFKDTKIPFAVTVTKMSDGNMLIINSGKLLDAILCSAAYPGVFPLRKYKGDYVTDGGVVEAVPISLVQKMGADKTIGVDLWNIKKSQKIKKTLIFSVQRSLQILMKGLAKVQQENYKNTLFIKPNVPRNHSPITTFSFHKSKEFILEGEKATKKQLKKIKEFIQ